MSFATAAVSHELGEWASEVSRTIFHEHHHIVGEGIRALVAAAVLGTIIYLIGLAFR
jgi:hypothetical protein